MQKGEITHQAIIEQSAHVFNLKGYAGTSMGDLMEATGLSKGAIYNHFSSKDDLAIQVFDYAVERVQEIMRDAIRRAPKHSIHRLVAVVRLFRNYIENSVFEGGCPMLNTSVEVDDTHPVLRAHARHAMTIWREFITGTIQRGIHEGQVKSEIDSDAAADIIIAMIEGGIMISKLYNDSSHINRIVDHLVQYITETLAA